MVTWSDLRSRDRLRGSIWVCACATGSCSDHACAHPREPRSDHVTFGHYGVTFHNVTFWQNAPLGRILHNFRLRMRTPKWSPEDGHVTLGHFRNRDATLFVGVRGLKLCCLTPHSAILQLYSSVQSYWWRKPVYPEKTADMSQVTDRLYHIMLFRVHLAMNEVRNYTFTELKIYIYKWSQK
jgi:hypothetical protein